MVCPSFFKRGNRQFVELRGANCRRKGILPLRRIPDYKMKKSQTLSVWDSGDPYGRRSRSAAGGGCSEAEEGKVTSGQGCAQAAAARADYFPGVTNS